MKAYTDSRGRRIKVPRGLRPKVPLGLARDLGETYGERVEKWRARALALFADLWHTNHKAKLDGINDPTAKRPPSSWIAHKMAALRAEIAGDLTHHAIGPEIGFVAEKVERLATKGTGRLLAGMGLAQAPRQLERIGGRDILGDKIDEFRQENLAKISSLATDEIDTLEGMLDDAETTGMRPEELRDLIEERFDVTRSKADLLARDQVLKLNAKITEARQTQSGISKYIWSTSGDDRVRPMHDDLDGSEQSWDDPPVTNDDGDTNHPGEDYQCRCVAIPVIPDVNDLPDEDEEDDSE